MLRVQTPIAGSSEHAPGNMVPLRSTAEGGGRGAQKAVRALLLMERTRTGSAKGRDDAILYRHILEFVVASPRGDVIEKELEPSIFKADGGDRCGRHLSVRAKPQGREDLPKPSHKPGVVHGGKP